MCVIYFNIKYPFDFVTNVPFGIEIYPNNLTTQIRIGLHNHLQISRT